MTIKLKRAYDEPTDDDGFRVLVDRLWPRGVSKEDAALDEWLQEVAPSDELRRWFDHDPDKWDRFRRRYREELDDRGEEIAFLEEKSEEGTLTLVYAAKDTEHNNAVALKEYLSPATTAPFRVIERARWSDVDAAGIVRYGAYLRFFEVAETELFRALGFPVGVGQQRYGLWLVRRRVECDFFRPVLLDEEVEVFTYISAVGRTSLGLGFLARKLGTRELAAESSYALVAVDAEKLEPVPLPEELRDTLAGSRLDRAAALDAVELERGEIENGREE